MEEIDKVLDEGLQEGLMIENGVINEDEEDDADIEDRDDSIRIHQNNSL